MMAMTAGRRGAGGTGDSGTGDGGTDGGDTDGNSAGESDTDGGDTDGSNSAGSDDDDTTGGCGCFAAPTRHGALPAFALVTLLAGWRPRREPPRA